MFTRSVRDDSLGCLDRLRGALASPALDGFDRDDPPSQEAKEAALEAATALGYCRLFGVEPGEDLDGTLPVPIAQAALEVLNQNLMTWTSDAEHLESEMDGTTHPVEAENLCFGLLESRMGSWAADVSIHEAYLACVSESNPQSESFGVALDALTERFDRFDEALRAKADWLAVAAETQLLENLRGLLKGEYRDLLPWWLDGTLERVASQ
ncbi:MAG: hypothetical protein HYT47_02570 [Candidatus Vogelbacteria bacterium]|nr:hypothetical protein [Candidatus Vogelbacteria bacterium]